MAQKQLSAMTTEELVKAEKSARTGAIILGACIALMLGAGIYKAITIEKFSINLVTPLIFLAFLVPGLKNHKKIKTELKQRQGA